MTASIFGKRHAMKPDSSSASESGQSHGTNGKGVGLGEELNMYEAPQSVTGGNSYDCVASLEIAPPPTVQGQGRDQGRDPGQGHGQGKGQKQGQGQGQGQYPTRSPGHYPRSMTANPPPGGGRAVYVAPLTMREAGMGSSGKVAASIFGKRHTFKNAEESAKFT